VGVRSAVESYNQMKRDREKRAQAQSAEAEKREAEFIRLNEQFKQLN
jgi:hypothetical protein